MGLTKRKDGYYVEFPVVDDGKVLTLASGVREARVKRWKTSTNNKTVAKQQEAIIKTDLMKGKMVSERVQSLAMTFAQWAKEYVEIEEVKCLRSYRERCQRITVVLVPFFGKTLLQDITAKDVEAFRQERGKGRAVATVNVDHNILKHMLKHAMKRDLIMRNVASLVTAPKPKNARNRVLEPDEWDRLYGAAPEWFKVVLLTGYHTGMRLEEILTLTWDRVDLEKGRMFLPGHLTKTGQDRSVPLTPMLRKELQDLRDQGGVTWIQGLVFQKDGQKINHSYRVVRELCQEQTIPDFVFHDLRHCAVTNLADAGVEVETIMKIVGHSSIEMFLRYRTIKAERLDAAMSSLNTLITQRQNATRQVSENTAL
ncbi:MAG: site-specific integrase [Nitrospinae bacterium]|nr:site-specific integrase [Nitrospinota bacterium]